MGVTAPRGTYAAPPVVIGVVGIAEDVVREQSCWPNIIDLESGRFLSEHSLLTGFGALGLRDKFDGPFFRALRIPAGRLG